MLDGALKRGFVAALVAETLLNYKHADAPLEKGGVGSRISRQLIRLWHGRGYSAAETVETSLDDDGDFWQRISIDRGPDREKPELPLVVHMREVVVSEWVARVPGLYWVPGADQMRVVSRAQIERKSQGWTVYQPIDKSRKVFGGVGTLRLTPAEDGFRLGTVARGFNASAGIPALISPEVWEHHCLDEGTIIHGKARWRDMPQKWAAQFPVVKGIPRGCLVIDKVDEILNSGRRAPVQVHPFSIMEYWDGDIQLHDFVYANADSTDRDFRGNLTEFFDVYSKEKDRHGIYLTAADIAEPMWEAMFSDPADMRVRKAAQLRLIERRVAEAAKGQDVVAALLRRLSAVGSTSDLKRLSEKSGIPWRRWSQSGLIAEEAQRLVDAAIGEEKELALLYAVQLELAP
jgi:hypothetical protein